jgi:hypothetical protein
MTAQRDLSEYLPNKEGFCRPDWEAISAFIESNVPESEWKPAWESASQQWVKQLSRELGGAYRVCETQNFLIVTAAPERIARDASNFYEAALKRILASLGGIASDEGFGKHVVLMFSTLDEYYRYITYFYPEGEHPMSGGICLSGEGYVHFALPTTDYSSYRSVLVHELTHGCLGHLPIPTWLNESLAMRMEEVVCGSDIFALDREIYDRHVSYWNADSIQSFWMGESWQIPGESFDLSYNLAQVLWRKIEVDLGASQERIGRFIGTANARDGGEAACQSIFGMSLGDLITEFLGEGEWKPHPNKWPHLESSELGATEKHNNPGRTTFGFGKLWRGA